MTGPLILIILGALLLLNNLYPESYSFGRMWPVILIVIGVGKLLESFAHRGGSGAPPADAPTEKEAK
jgi:hypothetical protein